MGNYKDKSLTELLEIAKERTLEVPSGDEFKVCDLFLGFLWRHIEIGDRKKLGLLYNIWATSDGKDLITPTKKNDQGQQLYKRN